jgi:hypothetical protein
MHCIHHSDHSVEYTGSTPDKNEREFTSHPHRPLAQAYFFAREQFPGEFLRLYSMVQVLVQPQEELIM